MKAIRSVLIAALVWLPASAQQQMREIYRNNDFQFTGITVTKSGRMFLNFPRWSDQYLNGVVELRKDGSTQPYPDEFCNRSDKRPQTAGKQFVCVQSVVADGNTLWVVDPAAPLLGVVVPGGPKLVKIDLATDRVARIYPFGPDIAKLDSYLNDIRIDARTNTAYMTDSGAGGIVIVDLNSGQAHRAMDGDPSVMPEKDVSISVNGKPVLASNGKPPQIASDGIALSADGTYLYYKALTGATLYRVKTSTLRNMPASARPEKVATTFPSDGLWIDPQDRLYIGSINESTIYRMGASGTLEKVASDPHMEWPDTFTQGPDGTIYVTASHINDAPQFNNGKSTRKLPYTVFAFTAR